MRILVNLSVACFCLSAHVLSAQVSFQEVPGLPFLDNQSYLNGVSWIDVDNDNDLDVCVTGAGGTFPNFVNRSAIFVNDGNGNFTNTNLLMSAQANAMRHGWADIDNDDDLDLYIGATWNSNGLNELWTNNGAGVLTLTPNSGSTTPNVPQPYEGTVSWADYNNDGWVDLFLPRWNDLKNRLFKNAGNGTFTEVTTGPLVTGLAWTSGGFWGDYDNDGDQDIFVVNYQIGTTAPGNNDLFQNNGDGTFTKISTAGPVVTLTQNGRSANWVDANNDGWLDLFVCNQFGQDQLHLNNADGTFTTKNIGAANHTSWSSNWGDYDNDGDQDLLTIGFFGTDSRLWENDGQGILTDVTAGFSNLFPTDINGSNSNGIVWVDYDLDGWLDLHVTQPDVSADHFYKNLGTGCRSWLEVKCAGIQSNHSAIGATLRAKATVDGNAVWQMRQISAQTAATGTNPMWQHFGFQDATIIDSLIVEWPSGKVCTFTQVAVNQFIEINEDCGITVLKAAPMQEGTTKHLSFCPSSDTVQLVVASPSGGLWKADCGDCVDDQGVFNLNGLAAGDYLVRYSQGGLCGGTVDSFLIAIFPQPDVTVTGKDSVDRGEIVKLSASGAQTYAWQPTEPLNCATCKNVEYKADTSLTFTVTGTDANGCTDTASIQVLVRKEIDLEMPNAFSPNGDQSNDVFRPAYSGKVFLDYHLSIYTRWGERVFETITPGEGWDGRIGDLPLESDVYVYIFEYTLDNGETDKKVGDLTLIR